MTDRPTAPIRMPALFLSHGSPMNAVADNEHTRAWRSLGEALGRPRAILSVSAHWYTRGTFVTGEAAPKTIHDFGGFPEVLFRQQYPAPGDPALASEVVGCLRDFGATARTDWGIDHGTWSVLKHVYPQADIPVVQLSVDATRPWRDALRIGRALQTLRDSGVLVLGSGGIVHNLGRVDWQGRSPTPAWALEFDHWVVERLSARDFESLAEPSAFPSAGPTAVPTPDHYLPLLYVLGTAMPGENARVVHTGYELGTISLHAIQVS